PVKREKEEEVEKKMKELKMGETGLECVSVIGEKREESKKEKDVFPILELPAELSSKILSYMGRKELKFCMQSFALDKVHAELNKSAGISSTHIS
ncbi:hypothetical protein PFISCL1PPCAC_21334, partial [Pristionchus fissidentatus]